MHVTHNSHISLQIYILPLFKFCKSNTINGSLLLKNVCNLHYKSLDNWKMETIEPNMETEYYSHDTGNKSPIDNAEVTIKESSKSKWCGINVTIEPLLFALTLADGLGGICYIL